MCVTLCAKLVDCLWRHHAPATVKFSTAAREDAILWPLAPSLALQSWDAMHRTVSCTWMTNFHRPIRPSLSSNWHGFHTSLSYVSELDAFSSSGAAQKDTFYSCTSTSRVKKNHSTQSCMLQHKYKFCIFFKDMNVICMLNLHTHYKKICSSPA
jgi:hypothetical protein